MKTNLLIFLLLLAGAGIKAKAGDAPNNSLIKLVSEAGEQIHLASQSALSPQGAVSHVLLDCKKNLATDEITCRVPNQFVSTLQGSSLISQVVASQNKQTLLSLVFKSSKRGASMGAIIGGIVGGYLLGKELYRVLRVLRSHPDYGQRREVIEFLRQSPESNLAMAYNLPELLIGTHITDAVADCCQWLIEHHSPFPKKFSEPIFYMLSGTIPWAVAGALVGAVAGPVVLALNPHQAVSVALTVAHNRSSAGDAKVSTTC